jgi:hypothetical protein
MTENNKPEWFQIAEEDGPVALPKAKKGLPAAAVMVTALILGVGAVVGQVQEEAPANAVETASAQTVVANNPTTTAAPITRTANPAVDSAVTATSAVQNPALAQLPTTGDDEGDNEGEDDDEGEDD